MTSEGGGSVAFPVMTLALKVNPVVARDFSLMIQSCGMTAAAFTIWWMGVRLEVFFFLSCIIFLPNTRAYSVYRKMDSLLIWATKVFEIIHFGIMRLFPVGHIHEKPTKSSSSGENRNISCRRNFPGDTWEISP